MVSCHSRSPMSVARMYFDGSASDFFMGLAPGVASHSWNGSSGTPKRRTVSVRNSTVPLLSQAMCRRQFFADRYADLLDTRFHVVLLIFPKAKRNVGEVAVAETAVDVLRFFLDAGVVDVLLVGARPPVVVGADADRQLAVLATCGDQLLASLELALGDAALALNDVVPLPDAATASDSWYPGLRRGILIMTSASPA